MKKKQNPMFPLLDAPLERPRASRVLSEIRKERRRAISTLDPGRKVKAAFSLSVQARKLHISGLRAQGFTESEIREILRARRK
jgi:ATP/maltotriose-dependent transcriptional regulator MalT